MGFSVAIRVIARSANRTRDCNLGRQTHHPRVAVIARKASNWCAPAQRYAARRTGSRHRPLTWICRWDHVVAVLGGETLEGLVRSRVFHITFRPPIHASVRQLPAKFPSSTGRENVSAGWTVWIYQHDHVIFVAQSCPQAVEINLVGRALARRERRSTVQTRSTMFGAHGAYSP